jgi:hypothetical protein
MHKTLGARNDETHEPVRANLFPLLAVRRSQDVQVHCNRTRHGDSSPLLMPAGDLPRAPDASVFCPHNARDWHEHCVQENGQNHWAIASLSADLLLYVE